MQVTENRYVIQSGRSPIGVLWSGVFFSCLTCGGVALAAGAISSPSVGSVKWNGRSAKQNSKHNQKHYDSTSHEILPSKKKCGKFSNVENLAYHWDYNNNL